MAHCCCSRLGWRPALKEFPRQALHARFLELEHPATGQRMKWTSPLPDGSDVPDWSDGSDGSDGDDGGGAGGDMADPCEGLDGSAQPCTAGGGAGGRRPTGGAPAEMVTGRRRASGHDVTVQSPRPVVPAHGACRCSGGMF